jgi:hypothetical protein
MTARTHRQLAPAPHPHPHIRAAQMTALGMRLALSRLRKSHGLPVVHPITIPFAPPTQYSQIISGRASTLDIDLQRLRQ